MDGCEHDPHAGHAAHHGAKLGMCVAQVHLHPASEHLSRREEKHRVLAPKAHLREMGVSLSWQITETMIAVAVKLSQPSDAK